MNNANLGVITMRCYVYGARRITENTMCPSMSGCQSIWKFSWVIGTLYEDVVPLHRRNTLPRPDRWASPEPCQAASEVRTREWMSALFLQYNPAGNLPLKVRKITLEQHLGRCSNVILLTFNMLLSAGNTCKIQNLHKSYNPPQNFLRLSTKIHHFALCPAL